MALNFPDNPSLNDIYEDSTSGFTYTWNGTVWISVVDRKIGNIKPVDDISASFDGTETVFDFKSNGNVISPLETNKTIVSVGGVLQNPGDDYSVFGEYITFSTPPNSGLAFFGQVLQTDQSKSTLPDGSILPDALSTGGFSWNSSGDFVVSGILTSGTSSVTLDGDTNQITVGTAGTINQSGIDIVGIITAGSFVGDGSNLTGIVAGIGTTGSINTSGIITASSFTGDGRNVTDIGGYLAGLIYTPGIGATDIATSTGIAITFTKSITKNTGVINLRENAIDGTIAESFDITTVGSSSTIAISGATLTITPGTTLGVGTTYFVEVPVNLVKDTYKTGGNLGITSFTFETTSVEPVGLLMMGNNSSGELGQGDTLPRSSPIQVPGTQWNVSTPKKQSSNSSQTSTLINTDGTLWAWGNNDYGQLGISNTINRSSPVQVGLDSTWSTISGSDMSFCATKTDGSLWVWGYNWANRSIGLNDQVHRSSPTQIPGSNWNNGKFGDNCGIFSRTDGSLWGVGNGPGTASNETAISSYSSPRQLPGTWNTDNFDIHYNGFLGLQTDNTLWACGYNENGIAGQNDTVHYSAPIQIDGSWSSISDVGRQAVAAFKTDGSLWVWGYNDYGNLGQNSITNGGLSSPVQLESDWSAVSLSNDAALYLRTNGELYGCGEDSSGQLGQGTLIRRSSPVQIPGSNWTGIAPSSETNASFMLFQ